MQNDDELYHFPLSTFEDAMKGKTVQLPPYQVTRGVCWRRPVIFNTVPGWNDAIQRQHRMGQFYETKDLLAIRPYFPRGGVFVDIGANAGNHSIFAALFLKPGKIIPVEPNPISYSILLCDVLANNVGHLFDMRGIGFGANDKDTDGFEMEIRSAQGGKTNTKMLPRKNGAVETRQGDTLLEGYKPDVIKIDVEGMEMQVLEGLKKTIAQHRPTLMIEVDNELSSAFEDWMKAARYGIEHQFVRYKANKNLICRPLEAMQKAA